MNAGPPLLVLPVQPVWDPVVRVLHWTLVGAVALSALGLVALFGVHQPAGYVALVVVVARTYWGFSGPRRARFAQFVRAPRATVRYLRAVLLRTEPRHVGHNPLGGSMIVALLACVAGLALTGWLYTTEAFFGSEWVEDVHRALAWTLLGLVVSHLGGVIYASLRYRENLVASMWHGIKRAPRSDDID